MRDLILRVRMSDEEAAHYEGRNAMVVPLSDEEVAELRLNIVGVHEFLLAMADAAPEGATDDRVKILRAAAERMGRTRELIGRAAFVGAGEAGELAPGRAKMVLQ